MMGPWLIFAALINRATIALFDGSPLERDYGEFIAQARVTMLGVVPSMVRRWRETQCMDGLDWSSIRAFSSTGECSNPSDMRFLSELAGGRPVIEYCGGTEIGGGYIASTVVQPNRPGAFSSPALGSRLVIFDELGRPAETGELFLVPPAMGLSGTLLNRDHDEVYHADVPVGPNGERLRRHGDEFERLPDGYYRALGRADDTMNLGGIKIGAAEIERAVAGVGAVAEVAAIAVAPPGGGPARLIVCAGMGASSAPDSLALREAMNQAIRA
jgi:acetyl-CoA synthetase